MPVLTSNNTYGIYLESSSKNTLSGNMMTGNTYNFNLDGSIDSDFDNQIDKSNLVDGRPIYYIIKVSDMIYDSSSKAGTFYCISCLNVTLRNLNLNKNGKGIYFWNTSQSRIQNVSASNDGYGIFLYYSSNNKLSGNNASNNGYSGIYLVSSSNNTLTGNNASNNDGYSGGSGIFLDSSNNNTLTGNNASNNGNDISYYGYGITLRSSSNNKLSGNMMTGTPVHFNLDGYTDSDFDNHIDKSNLVDGKPIYYIIKASDSTYDSSSNAGTFYCISCVNVTIKNLNLNKNGKGIYLWNTYQSKIQNVNASNNTIGIYLSSSSNNTISGNNASSNSETGIFLESSSNNTLSGNNASNNDGYYWGSGIFLESSSKNTLTGNIASKNNYGIHLSGSSNNMSCSYNASFKN